MSTNDDEAFWAKRMNDVQTVRKKIIETTGKKRSVSGEIPCPVCGGTVWYSVAYNGHVHAACSNQDCVRWME